MPKGKVKRPKNGTAKGLRINQVIPEVRAEALRLAEGDRKRIEIRARDDVIVR